MLKAKKDDNRILIGLTARNVKELMEDRPILIHTEKELRLPYAAKIAISYKHDGKCAIPDDQPDYTLALSENALKQSFIDVLFFPIEELDLEIAFFSVHGDERELEQMIKCFTDHETQVTRIGFPPGFFGGSDN